LFGQTGMDQCDYGVGSGDTAVGYETIISVP
jgi:hypothetical protein